MKLIYRSIEKDFAQFLKKGTAADLDRKVFDKWAHHQITTGYCIECVKYDNAMPDDLVIPEERFIDWLSSLGWRRPKR